MKRSDLKPFDMECLEEIKKRREVMFCGRGNWSFWEELEFILTHDSMSMERAANKGWEKLEKDEVVIGDVWSYHIGDFYYANTVHSFTYLYVETQGMAIAEHGHTKRVHNGKDIKKATEWYIYPNGKMEICKKDETHSLENKFGKPIYVLSIKKTSRTRIC